MNSNLAFCLFSILLSAGPSFAYRGNIESNLSMRTANETPEQIKNVGITEKLGDSVDLSVPVVDETGQTTPFQKYFMPGRPVLFSLVYYNCPNLCNLHLNAIVETLSKIDLRPGKDYELVALSIDPRETPILARDKKASYLKLFGKPGGEDGFHFLTAPDKTIQVLAGQVGFKYQWDKENGQWDHASAAQVLSPEGKITRYWHGLQFEPVDLKLSFQEASAGQVGNFIDKMVWYCYHYDPHQSKYTVYAQRLVQLGGILVILFLSLLLLRRRISW